MRSSAGRRSASRSRIWSGWIETPVEVDCRIWAALSCWAERLEPTSYLSASRTAASGSTYRR